jgi:DNA-binding MarR family transcriptional regulator
MQKNRDLEPEFQDFIADLFAAAAAMQSVRRALARRCGLGGTELATLFAVSRLSLKGPVSVRSVAKHLHLPPPNITARINELVAAGFLGKVASPTDSRSVQITLTAAGQKFLRSLAPLLDQMNRVMFKSLSKKTIEEYAELYREIVARTPATIATLKEYPQE